MFLISDDFPACYCSRGVRFYWCFCLHRKLPTVLAVLDNWTLLTSGGILGFPCHGSAPEVDYYLRCGRCLDRLAPSAGSRDKPLLKEVRKRVD